ncbi:YegP family protein [Lysobacter sp. SG-8]|uniref:YegP family protein n=1 Tax=Marilutibacter penaei TaxID=2759900 RepID=A0A7W3YEK0_9GAMM|nr:YegP family protein [Lysobacter penaei]MBB1088232.1 YegP family protein [Lysobacter penaei]
MAGKFEITTRTNGEFQFNLLAGNGQVILTSEGYTAKASCMNGVESVRTHSEQETNFDRLTASDDRPYFTLKASNGQVIGRSQLYSSPSARDNGIQSVMVHAPSALLNDKTA